APPSMSGDVRCRAPSREAIYRPLFDQVVQHPRDGVRRSEGLRGASSGALNLSHAMRMRHAACRSERMSERVLVFPTGVDTMSLKTLEDLFQHELRDILHAEKQILKAL